MKRPNKIKEWIFIVLAIVSMIAGICIAYSDFNRRTITNETDIKDAKIEVKAVQAEVGVHNVVIGKLQTDIGYISKGMDKALAGIEELRWGIGLTNKRPVISEPNR